MINRIDGFIEEKDGDKYLSIASADRNSEALKKYSEVWSGIKDCIEKINDSDLGEYDKDFMKIKFNSDNDIPLNKQLYFLTITVIIRNIFEEDCKYYPHFFLDECLYEVQMLEYDRIDISEDIDMSKTNKSRECGICHYWYFLDKNFNDEKYLCNGCHDLMQKAMNFNDVAILSIKGNDYRMHFWYMSKNDAIVLMTNSNLKDKNGIL